MNEITFTYINDDGEELEEEFCAAFEEEEDRARSLVTMYHVMQSGPSRHARSASGVYPFSVYRSLVKGVAERHCRQSNVGYMGEVSFEVVTVTTKVDDNHYRPNNLRSSNQIAGNK